MKRRSARAGVVVAGGLLVAQAILACGSRTGLFVLGGPPDAAVVYPDGPFIVTPDTAVDGPPDAGTDSTPDVSPDALPPIDAEVPDVVVVGCLDAGATEIYLLSNEGELLSFYPPTLTFSTIGTIACPSEPSAPNSMGVNRTGTAFVNFSDGELFQVSTATAACVSTPYAAGQGSFMTYGMGYVGNPADGGDSLYVGGDSPPNGLASIDTTSFILSPVGQFGPNPIGAPELTGTGDGRLFVFYTDPDDPSSSIVSQIDPTTAREVASNSLPGVQQGNDYAFSFWGGDFYLFTYTGGGQSTVTRFSPSDGSITVVAELPVGTVIVGAGVSTCAPQ